MANKWVRRHNDCRRCPVIGAEDIPSNDYYQFFLLRFSIGVARDLCRKAMLHRVDRDALRKWLDSTWIEPAHLDHLPANLGPGIMVTLPNNCGRLVIDGNHRAARALRDGDEFIAYLLPEKETHDLLRRSMGQTAADYLWNKLASSKPHPADSESGV